MKKRRGVASIIAAIFLVILMGISMMAFLSIYNKYKGVYLVESQMNEWEAQRLKEKLVEIRQSGTGGDGGGDGTNTLTKTFLVSEETVNSGDLKSDTPRLWLFDQRKVNDPDYYHVDSNGADEVDVTITILTSELQSYTDGTWDFTVRMYLCTKSANMDVTIYAYNHQTGQFDVIDSFTTTTASYFEWTKNLEWGIYVNNKNLILKIHEERANGNNNDDDDDDDNGHGGHGGGHGGGGGGKIHLRIDELVLEGTYTSTQSLTYGRFNVTSTDPASSPTELNYLKVRDGNYFSILGDVEQTFTITGLSTSATYQDISAYVTLATDSISRYDVEIYAYDYTNDNWVLKNTTSLNQNEELRIRVPLSTDFISNGGIAQLKVVTDKLSGLYLYIDELAIEATWVEGGGGGTGGSLIIRNDSPFTCRIVRIWYIGSDSIYVYDPSTPIALQPGETMDLADYHSLSGITLVKVVTDFGNVFSFVP